MGTPPNQTRSLTGRRTEEDRVRHQVLRGGKLGEGTSCAINLYSPARWASFISSPSYPQPLVPRYKYVEDRIHAVSRGRGPLRVLASHGCGAKTGVVELELGW